MKQTTYYSGAAIACLVVSVMVFIMAVKAGDIYWIYVSGLTQTLAIILFITERSCQVEKFIKNIGRAQVKDMSEEIKKNNQKIDNETKY